MFRKGPHSIDLAVAVLGHKGLKAIAQIELHFDQYFRYNVHLIICLWFSQGHFAFLDHLEPLSQHQWGPIHKVQCVQRDVKSLAIWSRPKENKNSLGGKSNGEKSIKVLYFIYYFGRISPLLSSNSKDNKNWLLLFQWGLTAQKRGRLV